MHFDSKFVEVSLSSASARHAVSRNMWKSLYIFLIARGFLQLDACNLEQILGLRKGGAWAQNHTNRQGSKQASNQVRKLAASKQANKQACRQASKQASKQANQRARKQRSFQQAGTAKCILSVPISRPPVALLRGQT